MRRLSAAVIAAVSLIAFAHVASAADLPRKAPAYTPPPPPVLSWTGWYAGVNAGWIDATGDTNTDAAILRNSSDPINGTNLAANATNQFGNRPNGILGGAQFGYNYQFSPAFVVGFEADIQGSGLEGNASATSIRGTIPAEPLWVTATTVSNRLDYLGTYRGRIGVTLTPSLLWYATGGLAYGHVKSNTFINFANTAVPGAVIPGSTLGSFSGTRAGWTAGGGVEWMFDRNWSAKLEYLHYDLGSVAYATGGYNVGLDDPASTFPGFGTVSMWTRTTVHFNGDIVRVGLNYIFHSAADLPRKATPPVVPPAPIYNWTGWYIGLNAGGGWGNNGGIDNTVSSSFCNTGLAGCSIANEFSNAAVAAVPLSFDTSGSGFIGGGQIGYNWQKGQVVWGVEADFQGASIKGSAAQSGTAVPVGFPLNTVSIAGSASQKLDFLGTLRGRLGWTPSNPWLLYVTGGLAYGHVKTAVAFTETVGGPPCPTATGCGPSPSTFVSDDQWRAGWTVGGGLEWMLNQHWTIRGEYLYYDLGSAALNSSVIQLNGVAVPYFGVGIASEAQYKGSIARAAVNYKF